MNIRCGQHALLKTLGYDVVSTCHGRLRVHQRCKKLNSGKPASGVGGQSRPVAEELKGGRCWCGNVEVELHELVLNWLRRMKRKKFGFWPEDLGGM